MCDFVSLVCVGQAKACFYYFADALIPVMDYFCKRSKFLSEAFSLFFYLIY